MIKRCSTVRLRLDLQRGYGIAGVWQCQAGDFTPALLKTTSQFSPSNIILMVHEIRKTKSAFNNQILSFTAIVLILLNLYFSQNAILEEEKIFNPNARDFFSFFQKKRSYFKLQIELIIRCL